MARLVGGRGPRPSRFQGNALMMLPLFKLFSVFFVCFLHVFLVLVILSLSSSPVLALSFVCRCFVLISLCFNPFLSFLFLRFAQPITILTKLYVANPKLIFQFCFFSSHSPDRTKTRSSKSSDELEPPCLAFPWHRYSAQVFRRLWLPVLVQISYLWFAPRIRIFRLENL